MESDDNHDVLSDDEDWRRPLDDDVLFAPLGITASKITTVAKQLGVAASPGDSLLVSKLGHQRTIVHIDMDCFYAQVEMIRNPKLRNKPVGVRQKSLMVTCNYIARGRGVTKVMGLKEAKEKCPDIVIVCGEDLTHYRKMSYKISEHLQQFSPLVERLGLDENYIDVSEMVTQRLAEMTPGTAQGVAGWLYGAEEEAESGEGVACSCSCGCMRRLTVGSLIASEMRESLFRHLGITCCAGVAHNKLLAKLVAGIHKPNQQTTLLSWRSAKLLVSLAHATSIPGIGHTTGKRLASVDVHTVQDVQDSEMSTLVAECGAVQARLVKQLSHGVDDSLVTPYGRPKTIGDEDSFKRCSSISQAREKIEELLSNLLQRLVEDGRVPHTIRLTVRKQDGTQYLNRESKQCPISGVLLQKLGKDVPGCHGDLVKVVMTLLERLVNARQAFNLTLINVAFAKLEEKPCTDITSFFRSRRNRGQALGSERKISTEPTGQSRRPAIGWSENDDSTAKGMTPQQRVFLDQENNWDVKSFGSRTEFAEDRTEPNRKASSCEKIPDIDSMCKVHEMKSHGGEVTVVAKQVCSSRCHLSKTLLESEHEKWNTSSARTVSIGTPGWTNSPDFSTVVRVSSEKCSGISLKSASTTSIRSCKIAQNRDTPPRDKPEVHSASSACSPSTMMPRNLPAGIDPEVFRLLPTDVQEDILDDVLTTRGGAGRSSYMSQLAGQSKKKRKRAGGEEVCPVVSSNPRPGEPDVSDAVSPGIVREESWAGSDNHNICDSDGTPQVDQDSDHLPPNDDTSPFQKKKKLFYSQKVLLLESADPNNNEPQGYGVLHQSSSSKMNRIKETAAAGVEQQSAAEWNYEMGIGTRFSRHPGPSADVDISQPSTPRSFSTTSISTSSPLTPSTVSTTSTTATCSSGSSSTISLASNPASTAADIYNSLTLDMCSSPSPVHKPVPRCVLSTPDANTAKEVAHGHVSGSPEQSPASDTHPEMLNLAIEMECDSVHKSQYSPQMSPIPKSPHSPPKSPHSLQISPIPVSPKSPQTSSIPEHSHSPQMSSIPVSPKSPQTSSIPEHSHSPRMSSIPDSPKSPQTSSIPEHSHSPQMSSIPDSPHLPQISSILKSTHSPPFSLVQEAVCSLPPAPSSASEPSSVSASAPSFRCITGPLPPVPPETDSEVFRSLPVEIQAELALQWEFNNRSSNASSSTLPTRTHRKPTPTHRKPTPIQRHPTSSGKSVNKKSLKIGGKQTKQVKKAATLLKFFRSVNNK